MSQLSTNKTNINGSQLVRIRMNNDLHTEVPVRLTTIDIIVTIL
jgi:hypothetical protein